jgi:hypothetical protein
MTRFLGALVLIAAIIIGVGWYLGWFHFSTGGNDRESNFNISVDKDKIRQDEERAKEKLHEFGNKVKDKVEDRSEKTKDSGPRP